MLYSVPVHLLGHHVTPFDFINSERYRSSPFSVPCPWCGATATYHAEQTKAYPTHSSKVAVEYGGADRDALHGTIFGECQCTNRDCQEYTHFVGSYVTESHDEEDPPVFLQRYKINSFFPPVPLIRFPPKTPASVQALLLRSFAPAFMDQSAAGNLLRSAIETLLTELNAPRFAQVKGKRSRLSLHARILRIPPRWEAQREKLLAIKWIGNFASHDTLNVAGLRAAYEIVEHVLEEIYGTKAGDLIRTVKRINRRKKP